MAEAEDTVDAFKGMKLILDAMEKKKAQLIEYKRTLDERFDDIGKHNRIIADGRILQIEQDIRLIQDTFLLR